jgi:hypothetical protein
VVIPADALRSLADQFTPRAIIIRHEQVLLAQAQQSAGCNASHTVEARMCRWLLRIRDLTGSDEMQLTQEFLAQMLGVRRSSISSWRARCRRPGSSNAAAATSSLSILRRSRLALVSATIPSGSLRAAGELVRNFGRCVGFRTDKWESYKLRIPWDVAQSVMEHRSACFYTSPSSDPNGIRPGTPAIMSRAFDEACSALRLLADDEHGRRVIATRIIDLASAGIIDAKAFATAFSGRAAQRRDAMVPPGEKRPVATEHSEKTWALQRYRLIFLTTKRLGRERKRSRIEAAKRWSSRMRCGESYSACSRHVEMRSLFGAKAEHRYAATFLVHDFQVTVALDCALVYHRHEGFACHDPSRRIIRQFVPGRVIVNAMEVVARHDRQCRAGKNVTTT